MIDLIGKRFGRLVVISKGSNDKWGHSPWLCLCDCGKGKSIHGGHLKSGHTKSCGCLLKKGNNYKHGHSTTIKISKTYESWAHMIQRCTNPNHKDYHNYGSRGITICKQWLEFENFLADMGERPRGHQIDRINNNKGYCRSNCWWVTAKTNNRNKRNNIFITYKNKTQLLIEWAEEFGMHYRTLYTRIFRYGWSIQKSLTTPVQKRSVA